MATKTPGKKKTRKREPTPTRPTRKKRTPVVEILTGILILGIILGKGSGLLSDWWEAYGVDSAKEDVFYHIIRARNLAIKGNHQVQVVFNPKGNSYTLQLDQNNNGHHDAGEAVENYFLAEDIVFSTRTGSSIPNVWNSGNVGEDPIQIQGGGHILRISKQGAAQHSAALYLMRKEDLGINNQFFRAVRVGPSGDPQGLKYNPETSSWQ